MIAKYSRLPEAYLSREARISYTLCNILDISAGISIKRTPELIAICIAFRNFYGYTFRLEFLSCNVRDWST